MEKSELSLRITALCEERGIFVSTLEKDLGFSNAYIQGLRNSLPYDRAIKIAEYLGVSPDYLMTGEEPSDYYISKEAAIFAQEIAEDPELRQLMDAARKVSKADLRLVHYMLKGMKQKERNDDPS